MNNLLISVLYLLLSFLFTMLMYKKFGKIGLIVWLSALLIISNIQTVKITEFIGFSVSLGNTTYCGTFLATDLLSENYGNKESVKAIRLSFIIMIIFCICMKLFLYFEPNELNNVQDSLEVIFNYLPRVTISSLLAYFISQNIDAYLYCFLKKHTKKLWIRNFGSTFVSQLLDTIIFTFGAFLFTIPITEIIEIIFTMLVVKWLIAVVDIPFMYLAVNIKKVSEF